MKTNPFNSANSPWTQALAVLLFIAGTAAADGPDEATRSSGSSVWDTPTGPYHQPVSQFPVEMGHWQDHASTLQEGILRGRAAVIQARGLYEVNNAQANVINEQARSLDLQNDLKVIEANRVRRDLRHLAHVSLRDERNKNRLEGRLVLAQRKVTVHRAAYQLSADDFDRHTGRIHWPAALRAEKYQAHRHQIEELFHSQFAYKEPQPSKLNEIQNSLAALTKALRSDLGQLPSGEYFDAHKFLRGLKLEAELINQLG